MSDFQNKLDNIRDVKTKAAFIKSGAKWLEKGDTNTDYFISLENRNPINSIACLHVNGSSTSDPSQINTLVSMKTYTVLIRIYS